MERVSTFGNGCGENKVLYIMEFVEEWTALVGRWEQWREGNWDPVRAVFRDGQMNLVRGRMKLGERVQGGGIEGVRRTG